MNIYNVVFLVLSIFILLKTLGYAFYEIRELKNKSGGITIIFISIFIVIFANIILFLR